jgi:hypothetical protein
MAAPLWLVGKLPGEANWQTSVGNRTYDLILGGVSNGGIIARRLLRCRHELQSIPIGGGLNQCINELLIQLNV